jgi:phospholipase A-2-activating protein
MIHDVGYVVTGGQEAVINIFSLDSPKPDPDFTLVGHTENICTLDVAPAGTIVSGSWDRLAAFPPSGYVLCIAIQHFPRTAKVWRDFQLLHDLRGHEQSVWAVLAMDEELILTGR